MPALLPHHAPDGWLMLIRLYADVSGKDDLPVRACAGIISNQKRWEKFEGEWQRALDSARVSHFHAKDFHAGWGEFEGWEPGSPKHRKFAKRFSAIVDDHMYAGFVHGIDLEAFNRLLAAPLKRLKSTPNARLTSLMMCCMDVLRDASETLADAGHSQLPIAAMFEEEDGLGQAIGYYQNLKEAGVNWAQSYASVDVGYKSLLPLQAADLLAHSAFRHLRKIIQSPTGERPPFMQPLKRLSENNRVKMQLLTEPDILRVLPEIEQYLDEDRLI